VDFELSADQELLQQGTRAFLEGRFGQDVIRSIESSGRLDRGRWRELGETGVFSIMVAEEDGGLGLGVSEAALVLEELGRMLVPGPVVATMLAAHQLPDASNGQLIVGIVEPAAPVTLVEHFDDLDGLLVLTDEGLRWGDPSAIETAEVERPLDALTPARQLVATPPAGEPFGDETSASSTRCVGAVLTAALQLGLATRALEIAVAYAKVREQFGRPIGSFQVIKHMCADMHIRVDVARAAVHAAAVALDGRSNDDQIRAASVAKCLAGDFAIENCKSAIQIHGGIGFTWEGEVQRYWKRACVLDTHFGNSDHHAEIVASTFGTAS